MSDKTKQVTINGRTFQIRKFSAREGSFVLIKTMGILAPMFKGIDLSSLENIKDPKDVNLAGLDIFGAIGELSKLSEGDFDYLQGKALSVCGEILQGNPNPVPVLNDNGLFGVMNLEDDTMTVMALMVHSLIFNLKGFFQGSPLSSLAGMISTSHPSA